MITSLTLKIVDQANNIIADGPGATVVLHINIGEIHYHKKNKTNGVNRLNSVQKATYFLKKSKVGINEMFSNC